MKPSYFTDKDLNEVEAEHHSDAASTSSSDEEEAEEKHVKQHHEASLFKAIEVWRCNERLFSLLIPILQENAVGAKPQKEAEDAPVAKATKTKKEAKSISKEPKAVAEAVDDEDDVPVVRFVLASTKKIRIRTQKHSFIHSFQQAKAS